MSHTHKFCPFVSNSETYPVVVLEDSKLPSLKLLNPSSPSTPHLPRDMKRTSDHQLTKDNADDADAASEEPQQGFDRAPPEVLAKRRILRAKRTPNLRPPTTAPGPNPFATLAKPSETPPPKPVETTTLESTTEKPPEKPEEPPAVAPTEVPAEAPAEAPQESATQDKPTAPTEKPSEAPLDKPEEKPSKPPAEDAVAPSDNTNGTVPTTTDPAPSSEAPPAKPASETPSTHENTTPLEEPKAAPPLSAPQPTPAPLKPTTTSANGTPKPAIIFGATTKPVTFASAAQSDGFNFKSAGAAPKVEEKKPAFKEATVLTGEEDDKELFRTRAKLYTLETGENGARWKERSVGALKLNKNTNTGKARLLMRTEATLRVVLNTPVFKGFQMDRATDRSIRFQGFDVDDETKATSFLAKFTAKDVTADMIEAIEKCKNELE